MSACVSRVSYRNIGSGTSGCAAFPASALRRLLPPSAESLLPLAPPPPPRLLVPLPWLVLLLPPISIVVRLPAPDLLLQGSRVPKASTAGCALHPLSWLPATPSPPLLPLLLRAAMLPGLAAASAACARIRRPALPKSADALGRCSLGSLEQGASPQPMMMSTSGTCKSEKLCRACSSLHIRQSDKHTLQYSRIALDIYPQMWC